MHLQVNTPTAELLYDRVISGCNSKESSTGNIDSCILDICCGTGTIGICAMKANESKTENYTPLLLGIELCEAAVENARRNAASNGISNFSGSATEKTRADFICSRAESVLSDLLRLDDGGFYFNKTVNDAPAGNSVADMGCIRSVLDGKRLQAIVDPPREVNIFSSLFLIY